MRWGHESWHPPRNGSEDRGLGKPGDTHLAWLAQSLCHCPSMDQATGLAHGKAATGFISVDITAQVWSLRMCPTGAHSAGRGEAGSC